MINSNNNDNNNNDNSNTNNNMNITHNSCNVWCKHRSDLWPR